MLAYKGFTTITNTGDEIENPHTNVGRAIIISIAVVSLVYVAVTVAVRGNLSLGSMIDARDYSLSHAAALVFGSTGFKLVAALALIATITSVMASMYSTSRMRGMMSDMGEVPEVTLGRSPPFGRPSLVITTAAAITLTVAFDLTRIAALGALAYLSFDIAVHWDHWRSLRADTGAGSLPLLATVALDAVILTGFLAFRLRTN